MTPLRPGAAACQACLALSLLLGHEVTELTHSAHVCRGPQAEICVDHAGAQPHREDARVPQRPGRVFQGSVGDELTFSDQVTGELVR